MPTYYDNSPEHAEFIELWKKGKISVTNRFSLYATSYPTRDGTQVALYRTEYNGAFYIIAMKRCDGSLSHCHKGDCMLHLYPPGGQAPEMVLLKSGCTSW